MGGRKIIELSQYTYTILLGGDIVITPRLRSFIDPRHVIAADSGMRHAEPLGIVPQLWVGDFDSSNAALQRRYDFVRRETYRSEKALTDGEIAIKAALSKGARRLILCGAFGGRADQVLGHMTIATRLVQEEGISVLLTSGAEEGYPLYPGDHSFDLPAETLFSLIGFCALTGVTIQGAKWCLDMCDLPFGHTMTISNIVVGDLTISIKAGRGMLLSNFSR